MENLNFKDTKFNLGTYADKSAELLIAPPRGNLSDLSTPSTLQKPSPVDHLPLQHGAWVLVLSGVGGLMEHPFPFYPVSPAHLEGQSLLSPWTLNFLHCFCPLHRDTAH